MTTQPKEVFAAIGIFAAGLTAGLALHAWIIVGSRPGAAQTNEAHDAELERAIAEFRAATRAVTNGGSDGVAPVLEAALRRPVDGEPSESARLSAAVDRLELLLTQQSVPFANQVHKRWQGAGYASIDQMEQRMVELEHSGQDSWDNILNMELRAAHRMWRTEDVLDRYGPPNRTDTGNGFSLVYDQVPFTLTPKEKCWMVFDTEDGWVTEVRFDCKDVR